MGHEVAIIGNHNLNFKNLKMLAQELSQRFTIRVDYGYIDQYEFDENGVKQEPSYQNIVLGSIPHANSDNILWISDEFYPMQKLLQNHGDQYIELPYFQNQNPYFQEFEHAKSSHYYHLHNLHEDYVYGYIQNDCFINRYSCYDPRWWSFCRNFMESDDILNRDRSALQDFREEVFGLHSLLGGDIAYYYDNQCDIEALTYEFYPWHMFTQEIDRQYKDGVVHITDFLETERLLPRSTYPKVFYDDFQDLSKKITS
ncbi:hypothetical protein K4L44_04015 [Halosquirtibacter laminarini]|uniref:Uncharacterized protein n=1 Tax=Halosquirtibacter laminarini TaxID=3374600 RepID=A0AC61NH72_9BACT|nr:hypothetical protein K4L44_04015 [Prolixibacteraceae bacterium]